MHAHKVIEMLQAMKSSGKMPPDDADFLRDKITDAVKFEFDFGEFPPFLHEQLYEEIGSLRLPFKLCYFELPKVGALLAAERDDYDKFIMLHPFIFKHGETPMGTYSPDLLLAIDKVAGRIVSFKEDENEPSDGMRVEDHLLFYINALFCFVLRGLSVMNCSNVMCVDNEPSSALNKKRANAGKVPLFSYKTLHLDLNKCRRAGGVETSGGRVGPRLHLRRGHIRRLDESKTIWVQACMVGDISRGAVGKDYRVTH